MNLEDYSLAKINIEIHEINIYKINLRKFLLAESKKYAINTNEKKKNKSIKFFYKYIIISNIKIKRHIFS